MQFHTPIKTLNFNKTTIDMDTADHALEHLTETEIIRLIERYYNNENVKSLISEYNIEAKTNSVLKLFPLLSIENCSMCNEPKWTKLRARTYSSSIYSKPYCDKCNHNESIENCTCDNQKCKSIREERRQEKERKAEELERIHEEKRFQEHQTQERLRRKQEEKEKLVRELFLQHYTPEEKKKETDLSLKQKLFLGLFIKVSQMEDTNDLKMPANNYGITPTPDFFNQSVEYLLQEKLIVPSVDSPYDAFQFDNEDGINFDRTKVLYTVNVEATDKEYDRMIQRLIYPNSDEFLQDKEFCFELWKKVAISEVMSYFFYQLKKVGFDNTPSKRFYQVFDHLLDYFSITQVYNIIFKAVANASKSVLEGKLTEQNATASVVNHIENYGNKAIIEKWNITPYRRMNFESVLNKMVFNEILQISYMGYEEVPTSDL